MGWEYIRQTPKNLNPLYPGSVCLNSEQFIFVFLFAFVLVTLIPQ